MFHLRRRPLSAERKASGLSKFRGAHIVSLRGADRDTVQSPNLVKASRILAGRTACEHVQRICQFFAAPNSSPCPKEEEGEKRDMFAIAVHFTTWFVVRVASVLSVHPFGDRLTAHPVV